MDAPMNQAKAIALKTDDLRSKLNQDNIPKELKDLQCWVVWKIGELNSESGKFDKIPIYPKSLKKRCGTQGSDKDIGSLGTFEEAYAAFDNNKNLAGVGIALLKDFDIVALDVDRCVVDGKLRDDVTELTAATYSEFSPSGTGVRAFWIGKTSNSKNHADGYELFHSKGFVTVTGNQISNLYQYFSNSLPALDPTMQDKLERLARSGNSESGKNFKETDAQNDDLDRTFALAKVTDTTIEDLKSALMGMKSERADEYQQWINTLLALASLKETAYADNAFELAHEFSQRSGKYEADDLDHRWEGMDPTKITFRSIFKWAKEDGWANPRSMTAGEQEAIRSYSSVDDLPDISNKSNLSKPKFDIEYPPGFVGELAKYIFKSSRMQVKSFAIAAALTAIAQLNANRTHVKKSDTALNLYQCLIGDTGKGKEDPRKAIKRLLDVAKCLDRSSIHESIASGAALLRSLKSKPNALILMDELGLYLQVALSDKGSIHQKEFIKDLMMLFGAGRSFFAGKSYANENQNIGRIDKPYINLLGTTTPLELFEGITLKSVDNGFLNRFLFIPASEENPINRQPDIQVSKELEQGIIGITRIFEDHESIELHYEPGAHELLIEFVEKHTKSGQFANLWSRAEEMTIRVAGLIALGDGGVIKPEHVQWAWRYVNTSIAAFAQRLEQDISENPFQKQAVSALNFIRMAKHYANDKQFGKYCKCGHMPRGKLTKLLKVKSRDVDEIVKYLEETKEIAVVKVESVTCFSVL